MWTFLGEFGVWAFLIILVLGFLLWALPFLVLRYLIDRIRGRVGVADRAAAAYVKAAISELKQLTLAELEQHPEKNVSKRVMIGSRPLWISWGIWPSSYVEDGEIEIVMHYELHFFNVPLSPKGLSADGFVITPTGERRDMTKEELSAHT